MKKHFVIFLSVLLLAGGAQAQGLFGKNFWKKVSSTAKQEASSGRTIAPKQAQKVLARRKSNSFTKAQTVHKGDMSGCMLYGEDPICKIKGWPFWSSNLGPYEENTLVQQLSRAAKRDYFVAAHNRAVLRAADVRRNALKAMKANEKALTSGFYSPAPSQNPAQDLAARVKDTHKYIFLGEVHFVPVIQQEIENVLVALRKKYPKKQIFLLTEFLPNTDTAIYRQKLSNKFSSYASIWRAADVLKIPVVGLDPVWLFNHDSPVMWVSKQSGLVEKEEMWHSVEVLRLRNQIWKQKVLEMRALYPDALFVFHTGASHVEYNAPFSLSEQFPKQETFVSTFYQYEVHNTKPVRCDLLDAFNRSVFAWRRFVAWPTADMARLAGFDVRFKIPVL